MVCQRQRAISDRPSSTTSRIRLSWGPTNARAAPILHTGHPIMRRCWKARQSCSLRIQLWDLITLLIPGLSVGRVEHIHPDYWFCRQRPQKSERGFKSMVHFTSNETPAFVSSPLKGFIFLNGLILYSAPLPFSISWCGYTNNGYRFSLLLESIDKWKFCQVFKS